MNSKSVSLIFSPALPSNSTPSSSSWSLHSGFCLTKLFVLTAATLLPKGRPLI